MVQLKKVSVVKNPATKGLSISPEFVGKKGTCSLLLFCEDNDPITIHWNKLESHLARRVKYMFAPGNHDVEAFYKEDSLLAEMED